MRSLFLFAAVCLALTGVTAAQKKIVCYFGSWSVYRPGDGKFSIEEIDPKICTHAIYAFVGLNGDTVNVLDAWQDLGENGGKNGFKRFNDLRQQNPELKTLVAIGGWNEGSVKYSAMAADPSRRKNFIDNVVMFVKRHGFNGFDLDWEYPAQRGGSSADVQNFVKLITEMRARFNIEGLLLSAAVGAAESSASQSYNIPELSKNLDFINLMAYDLHGSWESKTGMNAPLYPAASETGSERQLNIQAIVNYWLSQGADPEKLILGVGTYGRSFTLANPNQYGVGAPARGAGAAGPFTREAGMLGYNEICADKDWQIEFDEERRVPYAHKQNQWVGFDNVRSVTQKAEFVNARGLGGAMVWSIETDDFKGNCGEKFPLIKTLQRVLNGKTRPSVTPAPASKPQGSSTSRNEPARGTNRPQQPKPNENADGKCSQVGDMADPTDSKKFIKCIQNADGTFRSVIVECPGDLCYNASAGACDWCL